MLSVIAADFKNFVKPSISLIKLNDSFRVKSVLQRFRVTTVLQRGSDMI